MKRMIRTICILFLAAGITIPAVFPAFALEGSASSYYPELEHTDAGVGALQRTDLDLDGTASLVDRFYTELVAGEDMDKEQIVRDYHEILASFDLIADKMLALQAQYYMTPWDTGLNRQIAGYRAFLYDQESYVCSLLNVVLQYREYDFLTGEISEGEKAFILRSTQLPEDPAGEETARVKAEIPEETEENAGKAGEEESPGTRLRELGESDRNKVRMLRSGITDLIAQYYAGAGNAQPEQLADLFLKLAAARNALARIMGFPDYPAYQAAYGSDVVQEERADEIHAAVRETIAPLYRKIRSAIDALQLSDLNGAAPSEMNLQWDALRPVIEGVHPGLMEAYDTLVRNGLYLRSPAALSAYTAPLYTSNSAFIFTSPKSFLEEDYINMTHEFGHFNNDYHTADHHMYTETHLSVRELHSQGLELLSWHHSGRLFGTEENEAYRLFLLGKKLVGILDGSVIDEMERKVYESPDMSASELKDLYGELHRQYFGEEAEDLYFFTTISHIYETPFYYMHYATSALNAFDLWDEAFDDEAAAVDRYMRSTAADVWTPYKKMISDCGLKDMQDAAEIRKLAERLDGRISEDAARRETVLGPIYEAREQKAREEEATRIEEEKQAQRAHTRQILLTALALAILVLAPMLIVRAVYRRKLKDAAERIRLLEEAVSAGEKTDPES